MEEGRKTTTLLVNTTDIVKSSGESCLEDTFTFFVSANKPINAIAVFDDDEEVENVFFGVFLCNTIEFGGFV